MTGALDHDIAAVQRIVLQTAWLLDDEKLADWIALFEALDIRPRRYDVVANGIALDAIAAHFERVRSVMLKAVSSLPQQQSYLQSLKATSA